MDYIITLMRRQASKEVEEAGLFCIQMDSTQDINVYDQLSIIISHVQKGKIKIDERLIS